MPEIKDIPTKRSLIIYEKGSLMGEEDIILDTYQCTLKCYSEEAILFEIRKADFIRLRRDEESWMKVMQKIAYKYTRKDAGDINDPPV